MNSVFVNSPHLSVPEAEYVSCQHPRKHTAATILEAGSGGRGRRLTTGLLWFQACLTGPCGLLVLSSAGFFFLPNLSFPLIPQCGASGAFAWNRLLK